MLSDSERAQAQAVAAAWRAELLTQATTCPVCHHMPALRRHVFTGTMALALIHLYRRGGPVPIDSIPEVVRTGDSLKKLIVWGLAGETGDGEMSLLPMGLEAVLERDRVAKECATANGYAVWFSNDRVWLRETLSQRYSYDDLMREAP